VIAFWWAGGTAFPPPYRAATARERGRRLRPHRAATARERFRSTVLRIIAALLLILCLPWPGFAVQAKKHRPSHAAAKKPAAKTTKKGRKSTAARRRGAVPRSMAQTAPTPERYQEIQQAMVAKGYGPQAPNGVWGPEWATALKRYQQDQKLEPTGKLNSMSLLTLGLGPKREPPAGVTAPLAPTPAGAPASPTPPPAGASVPPAPTPAGASAAPTPPPAGASVPLAPTPAGASVPLAPTPAGAAASPAPSANQPSSSSSTVREPK
jgi:hypothetical protein